MKSGPIVALGLLVAVVRDFFFDLAALRRDMDSVNHDGTAGRQHPASGSAEIVPSRTTPEPDPLSP